MPFLLFQLGGKISELTSLFSWEFLAVFLPVVLLIYSIIPNRARRYFLLFTGYVFFYLISGKLVLYLFAATLLIHYFGLWLEHLKDLKAAELKNAEKDAKKGIKKFFLKKERHVITFAVVLLIGILLILKYSAFFNTNINTLFSALHIKAALPIPKYLMPIGISFYTLQAVAYLIDVQRGIIKADDNLLRLALFLSFFPQIVEGPIVRYNQTAEKLWNVERIRYANFTMGLQRVLYGMLKKMVVADRLNPFVKNVFENYGEFEGGMIAIAAVFYTIQLYMDFSGAMDAVMGISQIFGICMPENFKRPFFSKTISEFWERWHITLGTWFKDYLFYPVTMSKPMKSLTSAARKKIGNHFGPLLSAAIALFCVWLSNGLWHGSDWNFIFFGLYHFALILTGNIVEPLVRKILTAFHIKREWFWYKCIRILRTTVLVIIGELFFRAEGLKAGLTMFSKLVTDFHFRTVTDDFLVKTGIDRFDIIIVAVSVVFVFIISLINEKGIHIRESLAKKNIIIRWILLYLLILFIIIFGAYGAGYIPVDPMYANF